MRARCAAFDGSVQISAHRLDVSSRARGTTVCARFAWEAMLADAARAGHLAASAAPFSS
jgi:hypothetical protein